MSETLTKVLNRIAIAKMNHEIQSNRTMKVYNNHGKSVLSEKRGEDDEVREINGRKIRLNLHKSSPLYAGSSGEAVIHQKIEDRLRLCRKKGISLKSNLTHFPEGAEDLFDLLRIDITARILDLDDVASIIATVVQNDNFTDPWGAKWFYKYVAPFLEFTGRGDPVNLVQIKTGDQETINFKFWGVGFEQDLYNQLFNDIFSALKVTEAVAEGYILRKNELVLNPIVNFAWPGAKLVATANAGTYEQNIYDTMQNALNTLGLLRDYQTGEYITLDNVYLMIHPTKVRHVNRAINGGLTPGNTVRNLNPITEIFRILPNQPRYQNYGPERLEYAGCGMNDFYMFIPKMFNWLAFKRDLTHVTGEGDTFGLTSDREAWYMVSSVYNRQWLGGSTADEATSTDPTVMTQDMGYIVHGELPTYNENT